MTPTEIQAMRDKCIMELHEQIDNLCRERDFFERARDNWRDEAHRYAKQLASIKDEITVADCMCASQCAMKKLRAVAK